MTARLTRKSVEIEDLMILSNVLTKDTELSRYLKGKGFTFNLLKNGAIITYKNGIEVDWSNKLYDSYIKSRLGGDTSKNDVGINGYLFNNHFITSKCLGYLGSPEILKNIDNFYGGKDLTDDFAENIMNYLVSFKVPINHIEIESAEPNSNKTELLVKYSVNALAHLMTGEMEFKSPVILLDRHYTVPNNDIVQVNTLKIDKSKVYVDNNCK